MSLGNLKNSGNKGNNMPFQLRNTKLLASIAGKTQRTPSLIRETAAGTIAAGTKSVTVENVGGANGVWLGAVIKPNEKFTYTVSGNETLGAFTYDGTGTELVISTLI